MNLVIDDAVEVRLAMKENKEEKRRQLGQLPQDKDFAGADLWL